MRRDGILLASLLMSLQAAVAAPTTQERMVEWTIESHQNYADPFNDVEVDVLFTKDGEVWRVPAFWRGGERWTVRFAPPTPGIYAYRLQATDANNPDLNGHAGEVIVTTYSGSNELLRRGMLRVSPSKRYFEHADGTPFYWLADTWWTGLSDRLSWAGFQTLAKDRKNKGFTVIQLFAGLVPPEEIPPDDPGFHNEGGYVWERDFKRINPRYFDSADRRIGYLLDHGMVPAIVGAWGSTINSMGVAKMKQHWRYLIARYGAYPAFWILGGAVQDPPEEMSRHYPPAMQALLTRGWTEVGQYVRTIDPYHHPLTVHEDAAPFDTALQDESLTDFDFFQIGHWGWASIGIEVAQLNLHYSRTTVTKPLVVGEIGYEKLGETHFEDFQRTAFWLAMLNGAAGHSYGANGVWEAYTADKPLQRTRWSFLTWEEGMTLPGSYQVGLGARLLQQYPWWRLAPHPDWVSPRGTTLLEPNQRVNGFEFGSPTCEDCESDDVVVRLEATYVAKQWKAKQGTFRLPYAAGIPRELRLIYIPSVGLVGQPIPTVLGLEPGIRYHAFWWEPSSGTRINLGAVERPAQGALVFNSSGHLMEGKAWEKVRTRVSGLTGTGSVLRKASSANAVVSVEARSDAGAALLLRFLDAENYVAAVYSPEDHSLYLIERRTGADGRRLGKTAVSNVGPRIALRAEVRDNRAAASLTDSERTVATPIVDLASPGTTGGAGVFYPESGTAQHYAHYELRRSPQLVKDTALQRSLYDAKGTYRGDLAGPDTVMGSETMPGWSRFGLDKPILLEVYRPDRVPTVGDWVLVLDATPASGGAAVSR